MDFEPMWMNLIQGFTLADVRQQESKITDVEGKPTGEIDTLTSYVFEKNYVICEVIVSENDREVLAVEFYVHPDYIEIKKREEGDIKCLE